MAGISVADIKRLTAEAHLFIMENVPDEKKQERIDRLWEERGFEEGAVDRIVFELVDALSRLQLANIATMIHGHQGKDPDELEASTVRLAFEIGWQCRDQFGPKGDGTRRDGEE